MQKTIYKVYFKLTLFNTGTCIHTNRKENKIQAMAMKSLRSHLKTQGEKELGRNKKRKMKGRRDWRKFIHLHKMETMQNDGQGWGGGSLQFHPVALPIYSFT
jgi:hypothetical protein